MKNIYEKNKLEKWQTQNWDIRVCSNTSRLALPLNEGLCQHKGDIRDSDVAVRGRRAGDTPVVNVNQDQTIRLLQDRGRGMSLSLHTLLKTHDSVCIC